ncbi:hypothetical protein FBQ87_17145 [Sphingobacteriales bacterium CHB3]|nr:hypothetical protein [Sphingobacteriales bacterium CHB3]
MSMNFVHATDILHWKSPWHRFFYISTSVSFVVFTICLIVIGNVWDNPVLGEDGILENLSALIYFVAFAVALYVAFKPRKNRTRIMNMLVLCAGFLGFMDELSFGERMFDLEMPVIREVKIDGVHDFVHLAYLILEDRLPGKVLSMLVVVAGVVVCSVLWYLRSDILQKYPEHEDKSLFLWACGMVVMATVIDLDFLDNMFFFLLEELFELAGGLALATAAFFQLDEVRKTAKEKFE